MGIRGGGRGGEKGSCEFGNLAVEKREESRCKVRGGKEAGRECGLNRAG